MIAGRINQVSDDIIVDDGNRVVVIGGGSRWTIARCETPLAFFARNAIVSCSSFPERPSGEPHFRAPSKANSPSSSATHPNSASLSKSGSRSAAVDDGLSVVVSSPTIFLLKT